MDKGEKLIVCLCLALVGFVVYADAKRSMEQNARIKEAISAANNVASSIENFRIRKKTERPTLRATNNKREQGPFSAFR